MPSFTKICRPLASALLVIASFHLHAQTLSTDGTAELDRYLTDAIGTTRIPGMVALVVNKDDVIYEKSFGLMDSANNKAMSTDASASTAAIV